MAKTQSFGYTDTALVPTVTAPVITVANLNYNSDFAVISSTNDDKKTEVVLINTSTPQGQTESIKIGQSSISNVYAGLKVPIDYQLLNKAGVRIMVAVNDTLRITDSVDPAFVKDCPFKVAVTVTGPDNEYFTPTVLNTLLARALGALYDKSVSQTGRILKGAVVPKDL